MPEQLVMRLYVSVSLSWIKRALYKIADPLLTIVYANVAAIVAHNIWITAMSPA
jgi:hypothetical protein